MWTDQGARPGLLAALRERWAQQRGVLTVCLLGAAGYAAVFLGYGKISEAAIGAGIMLGYGALLMILRPHSEAAALLGGGRTDERGRLILTRAAALSCYTMGTFALAMSFVQLARGRNPGDWAVICAIGGLSFIFSVIVLPRRS